MTVNMDVAIAYMDQLRKKGVTYSMTGSRTGADGTAGISGSDTPCYWALMDKQSLISHHKAISKRVVL